MKKTRSILKILAIRLKHLVTRNGDPHDISLGFGIGVFLGMLPGTGPLAALLVSQLLRVNRAAALIGSLLTNTWFSLVVLGLAVKLGAMITGSSWIEINQAIQAAFKPFRWESLFKLSFGQVILPVLLGYLLISLWLAIIAYIASFLALKAYRSRKKKLPA